MASNITDQSAHNLRLSDITSESGRMLPPIQGFENQPLVSLEKAVEPLSEIVPQVNQMVYIVKGNCEEPKDNLSSDESASIMLYSMEWTPRENSFYLILNSTLRSENRQNLKPWFLYLRLFIYSLSKLPSQSRTIYRGIKLDLSNDYPINKTFVWWGFSSCTESVKVLENEQFFGKTGTRTLFNVECYTGKDIRNHSMFSIEDEILLIAARQFKVTSNLDAGNGLHIIQLKEMEPPFPFLALPSSPQSAALTKTLSSVPTKISSHRNQKLKDAIKKYESYSEINLDGENLTDDDMQIIVNQAINDKQCTKLSLENNKISPNGVSIIVSALNNNSSLETLILNNNRVRDVGVQFLSKALSENSCNVQTLGLFSTDISDAGTQHLAEMLKTNQSLTSLGLGANRIGNRGVQSLIKVLSQHNTTLQYLYLQKNNAIGDLVVEPLIEMFKQNQSLRAVDILMCNLSDNSKKKLREAVASKNDFKLTV